ncbi:tryptophan synthase subunit beta [Candidatus Carsonella ruddii]|uniref:Tryptophan synthase beta chain n=1 Tax=Carsonella ruddii TaxID=114186 RepID=A0A2K8K429_CARRU|nr:tryptophan synthase subunit beta [Candidatus Carsonella ruddii]ATX33362.1 tryptophan synthase subunit beta [Candidatus Carsonella ruddii]
MIYPNNLGMFNIFGGKYLPELLQPLLNSLFKIYLKIIKKKKFKIEILKFFNLFIGRPTPIYYCKNISNILKGSKILLKREDLNFTGAHKINNSIGQILLAKFLKKKRIICETGAGMHGVATSTSCSLFNLESIIYMGENDYKRQNINVKKIKLLGGKIFLISNGNLKEAMNEAIKDWCNNINSSYYLIGTASGPHPYPLIVRDFQSIIGYEIFQQINFKFYKKKFLIACVGGGSNCLGFFFPFINTKFKLLAVESGGISQKKTASSIFFGNIGILHGNYSYILQDKYGNIKKTNSISAGLDYPGIGPEISFLFSKNKIFFIPIFNNEVLYIFKFFSKIEGIIPALETSHSLFLSFKLSKFLNYKDLILINMSGRGDKDL